MNRSLLLLSGFFVGVATAAFGHFVIGQLIWAHRHSVPEESLPTHFADAHLSRLPFDGEWYVMWGGDGAQQNAVHHGRANQNLALDLHKVAGKDAQTYEGDKSKNENYFCWGQPIYSPAEGVVETELDGIADNFPGDRNRDISDGNSVLVRHAGFVVEFAHLQRGSVTVRVRQKVKAGDLIGRCGNSGNSTEPHLHFQIQSQSGYDQGVALRPVFDSIMVNGELAADHSPVRFEKIENVAAPSGNERQ